ncbi:hypothetical protein GCM10023191_049010 [Actinoallomurus oryzae]|uniref:Uncharacterized protein n=1 Tax=Actinoallomurus oryzae TaxID=502180 RepID=A0ABP8QEN8_9ACTN
MNGHITRRRRLFVLLAGFFGFVTSASVAALPGTAIVQGLSTSTAAAADSPGFRGSTAPGTALGRGHRSSERPVTISLTIARSPGAVSTGALPAARRSIEAARSAAQRNAASAQHATDHIQSQTVGTLPSRGSLTGADPRPAGVAGETAIVRAAVPASDVQVRGPPSSTGSHALSR